METRFHCVSRMMQTERLLDETAAAAAEILTMHCAPSDDEDGDIDIMNDTQPIANENSLPDWVGTQRSGDVDFSVLRLPDDLADHESAQHVRNEFSQEPSWPLLLPGESDSVPENCQLQQNSAAFAHLSLHSPCPSPTIPLQSDEPASIIKQEEPRRSKKHRSSKASRKKTFPVATTPKPSPRFAPYLRKREPVSKKSAQQYKQEQLQQMFGKDVPILISDRPFLRDAETTHAVFHSLRYLSILYIHDMIGKADTSFLRTSSLVSFVDMALHFLPLSKVRVVVPSRASEWIFHLVVWSKEQELPLGVYYNMRRKVCYVVEITHVPEDPTPKASAEDEDRSANDQKAVLIDETAIRERVRSMFQNPALDVFIQRMPLLNHVVCSKFFPTFVPPLSHRVTLWQSLVLLMLLGLPRKYGSQSSDPWTLTTDTPWQATEAMRNLNAVDTTALVHAYAQSLLYHTFDHNGTIYDRLATHFPQQKDRFTEMGTTLHQQRFTKPTPAVRKLNSGRIGKFKGRQNSANPTFCITLNNDVGIHATMLQLRTQSLPQLLAAAANLPIVSELEYSDLAERLPMMFPCEPSMRLRSYFGIRTPFLSTCDPVLCFAPVMHLLWPDIHDENHLVSLNGKKWKLEFDVFDARVTGLTREPISSAKTVDDDDYDLDAPAPSQCAKRAAQHADSAMEVFLSATQFSAATVLWDVLSNWVTIVDHDDEPHNIYYRDPTRNVSVASREILRARGWPTTTYQLPMEHRLHNLMVREAGVTLPSKQPEREGGIGKIVFRRDPYHDIWKGSRTHGLAVRRHFRDGQLRIISFNSWEAFVQSDARNTYHSHLFHVLRRVDDPSFLDYSGHDAAPIKNDLLLTSRALQDIVRAKDLEQTLLIVDDLGPPRLLVAGHETFGHILDCKFCTHCDSTSNWVRSFMTTQDAMQQWKPLKKIAISFVDPQIQYAFVTSNYWKPDQEICSGDPLRRVQSHLETPNAAPQATYLLAAVRSTTIEYLPTFCALQQALHAACVAKAHSSGLSQFAMRSTNLADTSMRSRASCDCCLQKRNQDDPGPCLTALAHALRFLSIYAPVQSVGSNWNKVDGKVLAIDTLHVPVGLRCKHDYTKGVTLALPSRLVVGQLTNGPTVDVFITVNDGVPMRGYGFGTKTVLLRVRIDAP